MASNALFSCNLLSAVIALCFYIILLFDREITSNFTPAIFCHYKQHEYATIELTKRSQM